MAERVRRRQDDHRVARPPDPPLRNRRNRKRQLALQEPRQRSRSNNPRSRRLRNPDQLRRRERYRQKPSLKGGKIGRRYGVKFERRLTSLSRLRTPAARKPRTECCCQPVTFIMAAIVAPAGLCSIAMTRDCLDSPSPLLWPTCLLGSFGLCAPVLRRKISLTGFDRLRAF